MRWSIRYQLLTPLLALLLGVIALSVWTGTASVQRARQQVESQVRDISNTVSQASYPLTDRVLELMKGLSGADYLLINQDGQRRSTLPAAQGALPDLPTGETASTPSFGQPILVADTPYLCNVVTLSRPPNLGSKLYILYPESLWRDALWEAVRPSLVFGISGGLAALGLTLGVAQRMARRFQELERRTRMIAGGDFSPMPLPRRNDELRDLSRSVNDMAQRLRDLQGKVKETERLRLLGQVGGGMAHQLRNGITGARLAVQLHGQSCNDPDGALDVALRQMDLVESQLKRFLDLGRLDEGPRAPCDLGLVIGEAVSLLRPQCRHGAIELCCGMLQGARIVACESDIRDLFLNLIGNAIDAAGPGGRVDVSRGQDLGDVVAIEVSDTGPGPAAEVAERLFEPFVTGKPDGVGLGLAVARRIARAHGGEISWQRRNGQTCFRVEFPAEGGA
jgi:signal transduction histidine kinase